MNPKFTINSFFKSKVEAQKITMLTAYDYSMAKLLDNAGVDTLLVGDSLGMVVQGNDSTLSVSVDDMIYHGKAVTKATKRAFVVVDMPFLSYHVSIEETIKNAGRIIKETGADAVKIEGGERVVETIEALTNAQIPVMGHLGLTPQSVNLFGGFRAQGKNEYDAKKIVEDAHLLQDAGVFAIVLECIPELLARLISKKLWIPTIGIGAGRYCDGQVLVINDMLGIFNDFTPKFVKHFADLAQPIKKAVKTYIDEVRAGNFPEREHAYAIEKEIIEKLKNDYL